MIPLNPSPSLFGGPRHFFRFEARHPAIWEGSNRDSASRERHGRSCIPRIREENTAQPFFRRRLALHDTGNDHIVVVKHRINAPLADDLKGAVQQHWVLPLVKTQRELRCYTPDTPRGLHGRQGKLIRLGFVPPPPPANGDPTNCRLTVLVDESPALLQWCLKPSQAQVSGVGTHRPSPSCRGLETLLCHQVQASFRQQSLLACTIFFVSHHLGVCWTHLQWLSSVKWPAELSLGFQMF